jgi:YihY family inner membrane protein
MTRGLRLIWLVPWFITRRFFAVRGVERSSSLAYITLLSLVPMLATVAALYRSFFPLPMQIEQAVQTQSGQAQEVLPADAEPSATPTAAPEPEPAAMLPANPEPQRTPAAVVPGAEPADVVSAEDGGPQASPAAAKPVERVEQAEFTHRLVQLLTVIMPAAGETEQVQEVERTLAEFVKQANRIGGIGSLVFLLIALKLYLSIETTLNDVWSVTARRTPAVRMFSFTMVVFWGPVVIGVGTTVLYWMNNQPWAPTSSAPLEWIGRVVLPLIGLTMVYWLAPHTGVSMRSAFVGGLTATLGIYGLRTGFVAYLQHFGDINVIYGSLGLVVIFLVSLFASWTLVIAGAVTSYVVHNLKAMVKEHDGELRSESDPTVTALAVLTECFRRRHHGEMPPTLAEIEAGLGITHPAAEHAAERLLMAGLIAVTGRGRDSYLPSHESPSLTLARAIDMLQDGEPPEPPGSSAANARLAEQLGLAAGCHRQSLEQATFADLLAAAPEAGQADQGQAEADPTAEPRDLTDEPAAQRE